MKFLNVKNFYRFIWGFVIHGLKDQYKYSSFIIFSSSFHKYIWFVCLSVSNKRQNDWTDQWSCHNDFVANQRKFTEGQFSKVFPGKNVAIFLIRHFKQNSPQFFFKWITFNGYLKNKSLKVNFQKKRDREDSFRPLLFNIHPQLLRREYFFFECISKQSLYYVSGFLFI